MKFMAGDRVRWGYDHCLGRNYTWIEKVGTLLSRVKHSRSYMNSLPLRQQMVRVHFDGNKNPSTVPLDDIHFTKPGGLLSGTPGDKYIPANGTNGDIFKERWCDRCKKDTLGTCPILADTYAYWLDKDKFPAEWIHDSNGQPTCTAFEVDEEAS